MNPLNVLFHDVQQNSDEWFQMRVGRVGGSSISKIMANFGKAFGQPAKDFAVKIALEQITGSRSESGYSNAHMERGTLQEPIARALYEDEFFCDVSNGGFFELGQDVGVSPDGLVYEDGQIEIKSVIETTHYATLTRKKFDPAYQWQLYFCLMVTGREWVDFVSFCADFPEGKRLFTDRIYRDKSTDKFEMISTRMNEFRALVNEAKQVILSA